jgi:exopolysaccharide biosynthesis WecB/TagA/CpsF family protein
MNDGVKIFGLSIRNESLDDAAERAIRAAKSNLRQVFFFVNAHCINVAAKNDLYLKAIPFADQVYADGIGMRLAVQLCGERLVDNVNGTDLFPTLCQKAADQGVSLALLGAQPGIAERCAANMSKLFSGLNFSLIHHGYFRPEEEAALINRINENPAGILLVAFGVPHQELWIAKNAHRIRTPVILAVGGLFDFYSGLRRRAPWLLRKTGLEWTFRLAQEPVRLFSRYIFGNPLFLFRAIALRLRGTGTLRDRLHR